MPKVVPEYKEQAREKIIEYALNMFSQKGYTHTRMTDIANGLGVSKGAIYEYFQSKEKLFIEAIKHHGEKRGQIVQSFLDKGSLKSLSTAEFFDELLEMRMSSLQLNIDLLRETDRNRELRKRLTQLTQKWEQGLIDLINDVKKRGEIKQNIDSQSLSRGILALRDGLYGQITMGADRNEVRETWIYMMGIIMKHVQNNYIN
jgi:AcrR family transcriptional regulator